MVLVFYPRRDAVGGSQYDSRVRGKEKYKNLKTKK